MPISTLFAVMCISCGGSDTFIQPPAENKIPNQVDMAGVLSKHHSVHVSQAAIFIKNLDNGEVWSTGHRRLDERLSPASTSKIPHTLIALETDLANVSTRFIWDGKAR